MNLGLGPLLARLHASPNAPFVLATVIRTVGSSYRKTGAMMLIPASGEPVGLVSGGCLEGDLREHARQVADSQCAKTVTYDLAHDDTALWGLGLGCGGAITVLLEPAAAANDFAGLAAIGRFWSAGRFCWLAKRVATLPAQGPVQSHVVAAADALPAPAIDLVNATHQRTRAARDEDNGWLLVPVAPPPRLVVCGAGPDAVPVANLAAVTGWRVSVADHREAFVQSSRFAQNVLTTRVEPAQAAADPALREADAAIVMGHHLQRDAQFVRALVTCPVRYIGVLGPAQRRDEVLALAGVRDDPRVYGPAGLAIGADLPETIAMSILAEALAVLTGGTGGMLSRQ